MAIKKINNVHHYHPDTKVYKGWTKAGYYPDHPGSFLLPGNATDIEPPTPKEGYLIRFNEKENKWEYIEKSL